MTHRPPTALAEEFGYPYGILLLSCGGERWIWWTKSTVLTKRGSFWSVHRADLQNVLYEAAKKIGIEVRLGCTVVGVDEAGPAVLIQGGERIEADLIVGADGESCYLR